MHLFEDLPDKALRRWNLKAGNTKTWDILKALVFGEREAALKLLAESGQQKTQLAEDAARELYSKQEKFVIEPGAGTNQSLFSYVTENLVEKMQQEYSLLKQKINLPAEEMIMQRSKETSLLRAYHSILVAAMTSMAESYVSQLEEEEALPRKYKDMDKRDVVNEIFLGQTNGNAALMVTTMGWADPEKLNLDDAYLRGKIIGSVVERLRKGQKERSRFKTNFRGLDLIPIISGNELKDRGNDYYERFSDFVEASIKDAMQRDDVFSYKQKELMRVIIDMQTKREDKTVPNVAEIARETGFSDQNISQRLGKIGARLITFYEIDREIIAQQLGIPDRVLKALENAEKGRQSNRE